LWVRVAQTKVLRKAAWATQKETIRADSKGRLTVERQMSAWTVILIRQVK
jgi:hypothetical protein